MHISKYTTNILNIIFNVVSRYLSCSVYYKKRGFIIIYCTTIRGAKTVDYSRKNDHRTSFTSPLHIYKYNHKFQKRVHGHPIFAEKFIHIDWWGGSVYTHFLASNSQTQQKFRYRNHYTRKIYTIFPLFSQKKLIRYGRGTITITQQTRVSR